MNKIEIDLSNLTKLKISVEGYVVMFCKRYNNEELLLKYVKDCHKISTESLVSLVVSGYIEVKLDKDGKYTLSQIILTEKGESLFPDKSDVKDWIETWYNLWPKGVKSGNFMVRTDPKECLKKMSKFCKEHSSYSKGIIIAATKKYLDGVREKDWAYCKLAPYFIYKDGMSMLEGYCSEVYNNVSKLDVQVYREDRL